MVINKLDKNNAMDKNIKQACKGYLEFYLLKQKGHYVFSSSFIPILTETDSER